MPFDGSPPTKCSGNYRKRNSPPPPAGDGAVLPSSSATAPITESGTVALLGRVEPPRQREYLTPAEVDLLIAAARKRGRYGHRDATMILVAYRHGLRVGELVALQWSQFDLAAGDVHIARLKGGKPSRQPLKGDEIRALRRVQREQPAHSRYVFLSERGAPMTPRGFALMLSRAAASIAFPFPVHPHMLRHACGYKLANDGRDTRAIQDYLGHKQISCTVRYTELAPGRFDDFWND